MSYAKHQRVDASRPGAPTNVASDRDARCRAGQAGDPGIAIVRVTLRQLRECLASVDRIDEFLSALQLEAQSAGESGSSVAYANTQLIRRLKAAEQAARNHALCGVDQITIGAGDGRRVVATIGGFRALQLGPAVANTLRALATNTGGSVSDGLVPWKTYEEAAWLIKEWTGRAPSTHTLSNNIYRLRCALATGGGNAFLVQTDAKRRLSRFALSSVGRIVMSGEVV